MVENISGAHIMMLILKIWTKKGDSLKQTRDEKNRIHFHVRVENDIEIIHNFINTIVKNLI
jgi:hypothetical protein